MGLLILGIVLFIALVVVHELGHFWVARRNGVVAEEFGIFFPPTLWRKKMKGGWDFTVNLLPLGGFVKLKGEHDSDTEPGSFGAASDWAKAKIMLAGVGVNFVTALVLLLLLAFIGMPHIIENQFAVQSDAHYVSRAAYSVQAGTVEKGSPADQAGIKAGDTIVAGGDAATQKLQKVNRAADLQPVLQKQTGKDTIIRYSHDGKEQQKTVRLRSAAELDAAKKQHKEIGRLGVGLAEERRGLTVIRSTWSAPIVAVGTAAQVTKITFEGLGHALKNLGGIIAGAITGNEPARRTAQTEASSNVSGPLGIFFVLKEGSSLGLLFVLFIIAIISLTLAIMNVLPIPALDGGRLFVMMITRLTKKRLSPEREEAIYATGFLVLLALIILITIVDVKRFF